MPLDYLLRIATTPAPTFEEGERAELVSRLWSQHGHEVERDEVGNVLVRIGPKVGKALVLASHLDTVFSKGTDLTVRERRGKLTGPGLGDNSASLAVLTSLLGMIDARRLSRPLWFVANVGEEGLGDLKGAKHLLERHAEEIGAFVAVDGYLGLAVTKAVGVRRYKVTFTGPGGHSWGDKAPSALHALGLAITGLYSLHLPQHPRTTVNVGEAKGGTSINSIAASAEFLLDLRSLDAVALENLEEQARSTIEGAARTVGVAARLEMVGDRPGGDLQSDALLRLARRAAETVGVEVRTAASSTDANAAAPYGIPALALGVYKGGNAHREDEWVVPESLETGLRMLRRFIELYQDRPIV
ncbi:M20/M25/M40 family metallo-hydrolase [Deinococcus yavapaiensis]|uniref:Di/tripeptidase n=1 Tax=Deinococcus yavapaiensis KR-236 TaxID=694435 RepID=A0A318SDP9_9DEIO|nr:M20/M25/M40 family metallo-hydrolase [Deinococcus yavapaiensis]PYE54559.1 di/tripeptidase [Deinococcus yavapaiensis KR-236]